MADVVKLVLRLPKRLHARLQKEAEANDVSLNTEMINRLDASKLTRRLEDIFGGKENVALFRKIAGQLDLGELKFSHTGNPTEAERAFVELVHAIRDALVRAVPGFRKITVEWKSAPESSPSQFNSYADDEAMEADRTP